MDAIWAMAGEVYRAAPGEAMYLAASVLFALTVLLLIAHGLLYGLLRWITRKTHELKLRNAKRNGK